ncbi:hypothetical protein M9Y10_031426 [Tritrichomonas musculus]|uniref:Surface antigen BspA-like protein n=1 Tax=Tritrichomonas musculus TaxID=1915356 RepID=A0ABR2H1M0_9EUKA
MELNESEINFELNPNDFNAKVTFSPNANNDVFIPYSISHESNKYKITSIDDFSFYNNIYIKSINFPDNSQIKSFGKKAFTKSSIEVVHIPSNLKELKEKWCNKSLYLSQCILSNKNKNFSYLRNFENQIILGKSDPKKAQYNTIVFASCDLENITIPSSIEYLYPSIFSHCQNLKKVEFSNDSKLQQINEKAFSYTFIESITIPSSVKKICRKAFCECTNLKIVSFLNDSKLKTICEKAFYKTKIEEIFIPSRVDDLEEGWCDKVLYLNKVSVSKNNQKYSFNKKLKIMVTKSDKNCSFYDEIVFGCRNIKELSVPSKIRKIQPYSFADCQFLHKVQIPENSELKSIGKKAFSFTLFSVLSIPKNVVELKDGWCSFCSYLKKIVISNENICFKYLDREKSIVIGKSDPNKNQYDSLIHANSEMKKIKIPSSIKFIKSFAFHLCQEIQIVEFEPNSKLVSIGDCAFSFSALEKITIPSNVEVIGKSAFESCNCLRCIKFDVNSKLKSIGDYAFQYSPLTNIVITSNVMHIGKHAFVSCLKLEKVEFEDNSKLHSIDLYSFTFTGIKNLILPSSVSLIKQGAFECCQYLRSVECLGEKLRIDTKSFIRCPSLVLFSFPNACEISIDPNAFIIESSNFSLFVQKKTSVIIKEVL